VSPDERIPRLAPGRSRGLLTGLALPFRALGLIFTTPKLVALSALAAVLTAATLAGAGLWLWNLSRSWAEALVSKPQGAFGEAAVDLVHFVFFAGSFVVTALTAPNLVLAPMQDPLSEATEVRVGGYVPPKFALRRAVRATIESLKHTLARLVLMLAGFALLSPLNLVPAVGSVAWVVASTAWTMFWLAVEHVSTPASRRLVGFGRVVRALRQRPLLALGFGATLWVLLWVPVLNFLLMPVAVVSGTLLFRAMAAAGDLPIS
jgi:CysZ protein